MGVSEGGTSVWVEVGGTSVGVGVSVSGGTGVVVGVRQGLVQTGTGDVDSSWTGETSSNASAALAGEPAVLSNIAITRQALPRITLNPESLPSNTPYDRFIYTLPVTKIADWLSAPNGLSQHPRTKKPA